MERFILQKKNNHVVGFIQGVIIEHNKGDDELYDLSHNPSKEGWIGLLYVKTRYRGGGIGQKLLDKMINYFKTNKCTSIRLLVLSDNEHAIAVYKKNGFMCHDLEMVLKV